MPSVRSAWITTSSLLLALMVGSSLFYYQVILPVRERAGQKTLEIIVYDWGLTANASFISMDRPLELHVGDNVTFRVRVSPTVKPSLSLRDYFIFNIYGKTTSGKSIRPLENREPVARLGEEIVVAIRFSEEARFVLTITIPTNQEISPHALIVVKA